MMQEIFDIANEILGEFPNTYVRVNSKGEFRIFRSFMAYSSLSDVLPICIEDSNSFGKWIISQLYDYQQDVSNFLLLENSDGMIAD